jgi:hypothetical protein
VEFCEVFHSDSLLVLPTNIRQGWKSMQVENTLAYYNTAIITAVKSFIVQAPSCSVTYDHHSDNSRGVIYAPNKHL